MQHVNGESKFAWLACFALSAKRKPAIAAPSLAEISQHQLVNGAVVLLTR